MMMIIAIITNINILIDYRNLEMIVIALEVAIELIVVEKMMMKVIVSS